MCNLLGSDLSVGVQPYLQRTPLKSTGTLLMEGDGGMSPLVMCVLQVSYLPQEEPSTSDFKVSHPFFPSSHVTDETHFFLFNGNNKTVQIQVANERAFQSNGRK